MSTLGIYFGASAISIVESKGKQVLKNISILRPAISAQDSSGAKSQEGAKIVALVKNELMRNKVEAKEAVVSLSGKDLIIRAFEIPVLPREELEGAINFEIRKYIPFKIEDLVSGFQWKMDKAINKNHVLFIGIKKETLEKYLNALKELNIKISSIEYSAFSILRLLGLGNVKERGVIAIFNIDLKENDEDHFVVLENGFPLFSRDIPFMAQPQQDAEGEADKGMVLERLKREIRISLDYYDRTFPLKNINKVFFVIDRDYRLDLEAFIKELGLGIRFINIEKIINQYAGKPVPFSLSFLKGYCSSIAKVDSTLKIDLLSEKEKAGKTAAKKPEAKGVFGARSVLRTLRLHTFDFIALGCGVFICIATFLFGIYRITPLQKGLKSVIDIRPPVSVISPDSGYDELTQADKSYKKGIEDLTRVIKKRVVITNILAAMPRLLSKDMRLAVIIFTASGEHADLSLRGSVYLGDNNQELELINGFLTALKADDNFAKYFNDISITSIDRGGQKTGGTNFIINCRG